jgi:cyclophilin family peptidyl-prolyl cis-trans isomerase
MSKAFLEIDIGDVVKYNEDLASYNRTAQFYGEIYQNYGWEKQDLIENCTEEEKEIIEGEYCSRKLNGNLNFTKPLDLRVGRIVIEFFDDCPKTVANFKALCTGEKGKSKFKKDKDLHYKGCPIHRIVSNFIAQGGDVTMGDGSGGESIYGGKFNDEKGGLSRKFEKGVLGMANSGKNTNTSQFFFTMTNDGSKLNGKHVAFGKIVSGIEILDKINLAGSAEGNTTQRVIISDCGLL